MTTKIEWVRGSDGAQGETWNPLRARNIATGGIGHYCEKVSPGCANCYSATMQKRFKNKIRFNAADRDKVELFLDEETLLKPLRWRKPKTIFVCSMTDLFGEFVTDEQIERIFAMMALCPQHTFQVLTKRSERLPQWFKWAERRGQGVAEHVHDLMRGIVAFGDKKPEIHRPQWPLPNVWLGVSCEDQKTADERIPLLLETPAAVRFISGEPLLGALDLKKYLRPRLDYTFPCSAFGEAREWNIPGLNWVIAGGESGPNARPSHPDWFRGLRDQCQEASVAYFFKQHGNWLHQSQEYADGLTGRECSDIVTGRNAHHWPDGTKSQCINKKAAGRILDGQIWSEFPANV